MNKFTQLFAAAVMSAVFPICAMAQLAYNVPFASSDWDWDGDQTTIVASEGKNEWSDKHGICLGDNGGGGFNYDDKYVVIALAEGAQPERMTANTLTRDTWGLNTGATDVLFTVATSVDNVEFTEVWSSKSKKNDIDVELPAEARYVRVLYSGNFAGCFQNLTVHGVEIDTHVNQVLSASSKARKVIMNGQIYIQKDNRLYDLFGRILE